jgi:predicted Rossmann fold nucleotide-binding protein DprA/Smf involved in DNA uptake
MKVGIVGSRRYENKKKIKDFIFKIKNEFGTDTTIVSGGCKEGADRYTKKYTLELGLQYEEYPPFHHQYNLYCVLPEVVYGKPYNRKYYFVRNKQIAENSDYVVAFIPEGVVAKGSISTIKYAEKFNKKTIIID